MRTVIFLGSHKKFSGLRLGAALGAFLQTAGNEVYLAGTKKQIPAYVSLPVLALPAVPTAKGIATALKKAGAQKVISFAHLPACEAAVAL